MKDGGAVFLRLCSVLFWRDNSYRCASVWWLTPATESYRAGRQVQGVPSALAFGYAQICYAAALGLAYASTIGRGVPALLHASPWYSPTRRNAADLPAAERPLITAC